MIRFIPDNLREALMRPIAMAAPDAGVYTEIMAPDFRFVFIVALAAVWLVLALRRKRPSPPTLLLLGLITAAFVPWLATSGNGRYFIPMLLVAGPLCLALIHQLPFTRSLRALAGLAVVACQLFLVQANNPWHWWGLAQWNDAPFFETASSPLTSVPATYVTISSISYSLLIPRFPASSHWINLTGLRGGDTNSRDGRRAQAFLDAAQVLKVVFPSMPDQMKPGPEPGDALLTAINGLLAGHRLTIPAHGRCGFLQSNGLASMASRQVQQQSGDAVAETGFWICPLTRTAAAPEPAPDAVHPEDKVYDRLEAACPRLFPRGARTLTIPNGTLRSYVDSDMKVYVLDGNIVLYKYLRALNPQVIGSVSSVLDAHFTMDCNHIRGRSGLPWEREI